MRSIFPSLLRSDTCYTLHADTMALWDQAYRSVRPLGPQCGQFWTGGDGQTQHGHESAACAEHFGDYCASLAAYLVALEKTDPEQAERVASHAVSLFGCGFQTSRELIRFALTVKYEEGGKPRFYNLSECKLSSRPALRHDKRWTEVKSGHKGETEADSAYWVLTGASEDAPGRLHAMFMLERVALRFQVARVAEEYDRAWLGSDLWLSLGLDLDAKWAAADGFQTLVDLVHNFVNRSHLRRNVETWQRNYVRRPEPAASEPEASEPSEPASPNHQAA